MNGQTEDLSDGTDFIYVDSKEGLTELLKSIGGPECQRCAIDTEADSLHCYEEKLCLIQFAAANQLAVIDPFPIDNLTELLDFLDSTDVWLHGADFDMRIMQKTFGRVPGAVYDTQTASRLLGVKKFGLANLAEDHFGVVLPKGSQKADWGQRPLPDKMLDYAVNDVRYLLKIADTLTNRLEEAGRWSWFVESCDAARASASVIKEKDEDMVWRISGWGKLHRKGMAFLRALWFWRDGEAKRRDRPLFKIIGNHDLLDFANELQAGNEVRLPDRFPPQSVRRFNEAIANVKQLGSDELPQIPKRVRGKRDVRAEKRFDKLKALRDKAAEGLDIDPTLIASRGILERVAASPEKGDQFLLNWQTELLEPVLSDFLETVGED